MSPVYHIPSMFCKPSSFQLIKTLSSSNHLKFMEGLIEKHTQSCCCSLRFSQEKHRMSLFFNCHKFHCSWQTAGVGGFFFFPFHIIKKTMYISEVNHWNDICQYFFSILKFRLLLIKKKVYFYHLFIIDHSICCMIIWNMFILCHSVYVY